MTAGTRRSIRRPAHAYPSVYPATCSRALSSTGELLGSWLRRRRYGEGHRHLAMTAVGGDLDIVGRLAARAVVSTLLEDEGYLSERLPADHGVVGLRPAIDREPEEPFDVERSLHLSWHSLGSPLPDCPSCGPIR